MMTFLHYLPYLLFAGLIAFIFAIFSGDNDHRTDYRRAPRQKHYQWNDNSAHRDRF